MALHNNRRNSGVKNRFFLYRNFNFWFIFLMVFNAIDSPDIVSSSKQPKYDTLEYCFISISLYIILSFPAFFNLCFEPKNMDFVLSSPRWMLNLLSMYHSHKLVKFLINVQLYEHLYVGMLNQNRLHIKTNRNEWPGPYH